MLFHTSLIENWKDDELSIQRALCKNEKTYILRRTNARFGEKMLENGKNTSIEKKWIIMLWENMKKIEEQRYHRWTACV